MRTKSSILNILASSGGQLINLILSVIGRIIFIHYLNAEYLGVNGLFTEILTMLSLAELGIGNAIIYSLYLPIAEDNKAKISAYMNFYKKMYWIIAGVVLVIGISIMPFLNIIIKNAPDIPNLSFIYLLYVINMFSSYFLSYKQSLIMANQKQYINAIYTHIGHIIQTIIQIIVLVFTKNFILYLMVQFFMQFIINFTLSKKADKMYSLDKNAKLDKNEIKALTKNIKAMFIHKMSGVIVNNTDNILISSFIGILSVGIYSNYQLITRSMKTLLSYIYGSFTASVGNLIAEGDMKKAYKIYRMLNFIVSALFAYCSIGFLLLSNSFIEIFFGKDLTFSLEVIIILALIFYFNGSRQMTLVFRDAMGLFYKDRYRPIAETIINLVVSIILAKRIGITGIFLGTIISGLLTSFWLEPYILFRYGFKETKKMKEYYYNYGKLFFSILAIYFVSISIINITNLKITNIFLLLLTGCVYTIIFLSFIYLIYKKDIIFQDIQENIQNFKNLIQKK